MYPTSLSSFLYCWTDCIPLVYQKKNGSSIFQKVEALVLAAVSPQSPPGPSSVLVLGWRDRSSGWSADGDFLKWVYPQIIPFFMGFSWTKTIQRAWGTPMTRETPYVRNVKLLGIGLNCWNCRRQIWPQMRRVSQDPRRATMSSAAVYWVLEQVKLEDVICMKRLILFGVFAYLFNMCETAFLAAWLLWPFGIFLAFLFSWCLWLLCFPGNMLQHCADSNRTIGTNAKTRSNSKQQKHEHESKPNSSPKYTEYTWEILAPTCYT